MKKSILTMFAVAVMASAAYSQGTINFQNKLSTAVPPIDAPISYLGGPKGAVATKVDGTINPNARAALYAGPAGSLESELVLVGVIVNFRAGAAAGYVNVGSLGSRTMPSGNAGDTWIAQIRAWDGASAYSSYEAAAAAGDSTVYLGKMTFGYSLATGGTGAPPGPAANMINISGFNITPVPEPSTIALGAFGLLAAWMIRRRK